MGLFKQKTKEAETLACPRCGTKMEKRYYTKTSFSYVCPNASCGYVA